MHRYFSVLDLRNKIEINTEQKNKIKNISLKKIICTKFRNVTKKFNALIISIINIQISKIISNDYEFPFRPVYNLEIKILLVKA